jgi:hypothetical protein
VWAVTLDMQGDAYFSSGLKYLANGARDAYWAPVIQTYPGFSVTWMAAGATGRGITSVSGQARTGIALLPSSGSATDDMDNDGIPDAVEPALARNPLVKDNDVFNDARLFAMQQYRDFLAREGDVDGINFWANQVAAGYQTRAQVIESFFNSVEFQGTMAPVARLNFAYFLRVPDYGGITFWADYHRANSLLAISNYFATSPEFTATYGALDNASFVNLVYNNVLGRAPDPGGQAFWTDQLDTGSMSRGQVMLGFSESPEYQSLTRNEVYVTMMYIGMLRRAPESGGFTFWVDHLDLGNPGLALIQGFLASAEYRARFLP